MTRFSILPLFAIFAVVTAHAAPPVVQITSPSVASVNLTSGTGLVLAATVTPGSGGTNTSSWSMFSGPGTVTFGSATSPNTTSTFSADGTYVLRLSASDTVTTTTADVTVVVGGVSGFNPVGVKYGAATTGSHTVSGGTYTISNSASSGIDIGATSDGFYSLEQQLSGDFNLISRVVSATNVQSTSNDYERVGLVIRAGTTATGSEASAFVGYDSTPSFYAYWITRATTSAANVRVTDNTGYTFPRYVRLARSGSTVTGYLSGDGTTWASKGSMTLAGSVRVGLAWSSDNTASAGNAVFDNVSLTSTSGVNFGPLVNAGPDAAAVTSTTLAGTASDDGLPNPPATLTTTWSQLSGPGTVTFSDANTLSPTATFSQSGTYVIRLTASDGNITTFDDVTVISALAPPSGAYAWYKADVGLTLNAAGNITSWATQTATASALNQVHGSPTTTTLTQGAGGPAVDVVSFDGSSDLWATTGSWGSVAGNRTVVFQAKVPGVVDGFLFDGSTGAGLTRAQVRSGTWQAGVQSSGFSNADPNTTALTANAWQTHIFTFVESAASTQVTHYIDGSQVGTHSVAVDTALGGLILAANGAAGMRLPCEVAEIIVYGRELNAGDRSAATAYLDSRWGDLTVPPFSVSVSQNSREIPRFGRHDVLKIEVNGDTSGTTALNEVRVEITAGSRAHVKRWELHTSGASQGFSTSSTPLGVIDAPTSDTLVFPISAPIALGKNNFWLVAEPERSAPLGAVIDARVLDLTFSGDEAGTLVPTDADPAGGLTLALVPLFQDVRVSGQDGIHTSRIPGIVIDKHGVLHAVYDHRYNNSGDLPGNIDVGYSRSSDGGVTWTTSQAILNFDSSVANSSGNGVGDPSILYDPATDTLWTAALWSFGDNAYHGSGPGLLPTETAQYVLTKSTDGGVTWSAPINITTQIKDPAWNLLFCGPGHGLTLRDGTLVFPSQMRRSDGLVRMCFVFSRDHGVSWEFGSVIPTTSPQTNENEFLELDDGRLLFSGRTPAGSNGQRAWSHYAPIAPAEGVDPLKDGTWSDLYRLPAVPDPVCQASVIQWKSRFSGHPREWILFANPATGGRNGMTLRLSQDGGLTWPVSRLLWAGSSAYSCLTILPDSSIGLFFERDTRITFARVEADWLMNPSVDTDEDGMPDSWETLHGLNPAANDSASDTDGDGSSNHQEYLASTDPQSSASVLRSTSLSSGELGWEFGWQAVPGERYEIETSSDLSTWESAGEVLADSAAMTVTVSAPADSTRLFFRAVALP